VPRDLLWEPIWEPIALDGCGRLWTRVDLEAFDSGLCGRQWTAVDGSGQPLEIYGSEGRGFEFLRRVCALVLKRRSEHSGYRRF
jgi:hypothetical protein